MRDNRLMVSLPSMISKRRRKAAAKSGRGTAPPLLSSIVLMTSIVTVTQAQCTAEPADIGYCLDGKINQAVESFVDISTPEWPYAHRITLRGSFSCWFAVTQTSYVTWSGDEAITVKYEAYGNAESGEGCEEKAQHCEEDQDYYPKN